MTDRAHVSRTAFPVFFLLLAVVTVFSGTFHVPLVLDDTTTIANNPSIRDLSHWGEVLFPPPQIYSAGRPLLNLSFALNYSVGGSSVLGYHVVNLLIHFAAALALFGLVHRALALPAFGSRPPSSARLIALGVAALWAVHPLLTSAVTYVSQRAECLMGLFYLLTLYCFLRGAAGRARWLVLSVVACALGMLTKEVMITAPLLVFLFDWRFIGGTARASWAARWRYYAGLAATWLLLAGLMLQARLTQRAIGFDQGLSSLDYVRLEFVVVARYLRLALWPQGLIFDYGANLATPSLPFFLACLALVAGLLALSIWGLARKRLWGFTLFAFFLLLAPTSTVIPIAGQPIAESRLYLPLAALIATAALALGIRKIPRLAWAWGLLVLLFGTLAGLRNADFRNEVTLWGDTVAKQPGNERAWVYYSEALKAAGNSPAALDALSRAIEIKPQSAELHNALAAVFFILGRNTEAIIHLETAVRLKPTLGTAYENLATILYSGKDFARALAAYESALRLNPASAMLHNSVGSCLANLGDFPASVPYFQTAVQLDPTNPTFRANLDYARTRPNQTAK